MPTLARTGSRIAALVASRPEAAMHALAISASVVIHVVLVGAAVGIRVSEPDQRLKIIAAELVPAEPAIAPSPPPPKIEPPKPKVVEIPRPAPVAPPRPVVKQVPAAPVVEPPKPEPIPVEKAAPPPVVNPEPSPSAQLEARLDRQPPAPRIPAPGTTQRTREGWGAAAATGTAATVPTADPAPTSPPAPVPQEPSISSLRDALSSGRLSVADRWAPRYPESARRAGAQGTTLLKVLVLTTGQVNDITVEQSAGHPTLDQAAIDAVRRWKFEPGRQDGRPVSLWVLIPFDFRLRR